MCEENGELDSIHDIYEFKLCYSLVNQFKDGGITYGVKVTKSFETYYEETIIHDISTKKDIVEELIKKMTTYEVTPVAARYIVEDYINELYDVTI